jgi:hypothetical protein
VVEGTAAAVAAEFTEAVAAPGLSADRPVAAQFAGRWVVERRAGRPAAVPYVDQWAVVPLWVPLGVRRYGGRWVVAPRWARAAVPQYADQWVGVPRWARPAMLPCVGLRATSPPAVGGRTQTFIVVRPSTVEQTFMAVPIMAGVPLRQVLP